MKHIIECHTVQEDSTIQCPDCPLKFPLKAALKYHQEMAHQAHAKICTVCGKVVRDMRKHRLIHTGEKPFECDRCSYRCARSSSLKRHLATHLNSTLLPPGTTTNQHHNNPQQQSSSTVTPQQMSEEEPKFTTHLALPSNVQLPATVTVTMPVQVHPAPQQQQQPQQQTLVSHHLSQLPHLQQQQHPQVQEQLHELQVPYDPNKFYINVNTNSS